MRHSATVTPDACAGDKVAYNGIYQLHSRVEYDFNKTVGKAGSQGHGYGSDLYNPGPV